MKSVSIQTAVSAAAWVLSVVICAAGTAPVNAFSRQLTTAEEPAVSTVVSTEERPPVTSTCISDSDIPVWDENGHYRGTNAIYDAFLYITEFPKTQYVIGEALDLSGMKVMLVEQRRFNTWYHDVSERIVLVDTDFDSTKEGTYTVTIDTDYRLPEWNTEMPMSFEVTVGEALPAVTTTSSVPSTTTSAKATVTVSEKNTTTVSTTTVSTTTAVTTTAERPPVTTSCISDSDLPVWDENGHYRGTNAISNVYLLITQPPKQTYALGETLDLSGMKVMLVEQRRFNTWYHDVSEWFEITENTFDSSKAGTYSITINTDYTISEWGENTPLTFEVTVSDTLPAVTTTPTASDTTTSMTTTATSAVSTEAAVKGNGDVDEDGELNISDVILLSRYVTEDPVTISEAGLLQADLDANHTVNADDITCMILRIAKLDEI